MRTHALAPVAIAVLAIAAVVAIADLVSRPGPAAVADPTAAPSSRPTNSAQPRDQPCGLSLQAEIDAAAAGSTLALGGCTYRSGATVNKPLTIVGATVSVPPGEAGITVEADDVTLDGLVLAGPQSATYVFDEMGVYVLATPAEPIRRLTIRNSEIAGFGGFGTYLRNVADLRLEGNRVQDIVYAGLMVLSGTSGAIESNTVRRIGVVGSEANERNAYGIVLTTQGDGEPPTSRFVVNGNTVEDVPTWHAIDTHGGRQLVFSGNTIRRSMRGIFITTDNARNAPTDIAIVDNQLLSPAPIVSNIMAITIYSAHNLAITGNTVSGWGAGHFFTDFEGLSTGVVIDGNTVEP